MILRRNSNTVILAVLCLVLAGLHWGNKPVPMSDFPAIHKVGQELWSLQVPSDFKVAPLVGVMQVPLAWFVGEVRSGWLLNTTLYPAAIVLLYLIGRGLAGEAAFWVALLVAINGYTLQLLTEPIIEIPMLFFILLTYYLLFRDTRWAYVAASAASMVRYECAALILAVFVIDIIRHRLWLKSFSYSIAACVPLGMWLIGTAVCWQGGTHYLSVFGGDYGKLLGEDRTGLILHLQLLYRVGLGSLVPASLAFAAKGVLAGGFLFGCLYGAYRRNLRILALLIFLVPYFLLHCYYPYPVARYHAVTFWVVALVGLSGLITIWSLWRHWLIVGVMILIAISARPIQNTQNMEFKQLGQWYSANAVTGDKMAVYMFDTVSMFTDNEVVFLPKAMGKDRFVLRCREQNINYVIWASREMRNPNTENYIYNRLDNIDMLHTAKDVGPYKFVTQIGSKKGWVNVYRL